MMAVSLHGHHLFSSRDSHDVVEMDETEGV